MVKDYQIQLVGEAMDLKVAAGHFRRGSVRIAEADGTYTLDFPELRQIEDVDAVYNRALDVVREVNTALRLVDEQQGQIGVGTISFSDDEGQHRRMTLLAGNATIRLRVRGYAQMTLARADGSVVEPSVSLAEKTVALARINPVVQRVARLWAEFKHDGVILYKIYELIRDDMGGRKALVGEGLVNESDQNAFTGSINRWDVLGDFARHATSQGGLPKRTFNQNQCVTFTKHLMTKWIERRYDDGVKSGSLK